MANKARKIVDLIIRDIRFPTSLELDGSDAVNTDPDYSCTYVVLKTDSQLEGHGFTFTCGRGNEIVKVAVNSYRHLVVGQELDAIYSDFATYWRKLTQETQIRWLGPEKGVTHLAAATIVNALWDLWAKLEDKPLWKLLVDMEPEKLVSTLEFHYITDLLTKEEALEILKKGREGREEREAEIVKTGYPAYTTSVGWLGYSDEKIRKLCQQALKDGYTAFKMKVGGKPEDDLRRVKLVRQEIGDNNLLMVDANQKWDVQESIDRMRPLAPYKLHWIEEPTSPDDIHGHATISKAVQQWGMGVATGEACQNRVMFKQFLQAGAMQFCQIDSCRMAGPNEILTVYLMAHKLGVPVCPHAGGVGLCELVPHLQIFDYICVSKTKQNRIIEYVDHLHEHFVHPCIIKNACYTAPKEAGYSTTMKASSLDSYEWPSGSEWVTLFNSGKYERPSVPT